MNILDFLAAVEQPDGYLERGYTEDEIRKFITPPISYKTEKLLDRLFYYAKAKADPSDDVKTIKKRFERECNDTWCMYTVAVPLQADHYVRCSTWSILRNAFRELDMKKGRGFHPEDLDSLEFWYQKTRW